jgi:hypothetical protein
MDAKEISLGFRKTIKAVPGKIFFFIFLLSFSISLPARSAVSVPFRTELHEKATPRVSKRTYSYKTSRVRYEIHLAPKFATVLASIHIRTLHRLKIFKKEKSDFHHRNGLHLRLPQVIDIPETLA